MTKYLKGDPFINRYRFCGTLETRSPLHIGSGIQSKSRWNITTSHDDEVNKDFPEVSQIIKDVNGKPVIPGSTLRGVMRHWLLSILTGFGEQWAINRNYKDLSEKSQDEQIDEIKTNFSWHELLFGTPLQEGKIEIWDANCQSGEIPPSDKLLYWDSRSLTYIDTSVAIDPNTGTAIEDLLYNIEVVPQGVKFEFNLVGQNLSEIELGLILFMLQGFNSGVYPIRVGSRNGRGHGLMTFTFSNIYGLSRNDLSDWVAGLVNSFDANASGKISEDGIETGYYALPKLEEEKRKQLVDKVKEVIKNQTGTHDVQQ